MIPSPGPAGESASDVSPRQWLVSSYRYWWVVVLGVIAGTALGLLLGRLIPRTYVAQATVQVDHNFELARPLAFGRGQVAYIEPQSRLLEGLAYSDSVLGAVLPEVDTFTVQERTQLLRSLFLPHPWEGQWRFSARAGTPEQAATRANRWASAFLSAVEAETAVAAEWERALKAQSGLQGELLSLQRSCQDAAAGRARLLDLQTQLDKPGNGEQGIRLTWLMFEIAARAGLRTTLSPADPNPPSTPAEQMQLATDLLWMLDEQLGYCKSAVPALEEEITGKVRESHRLGLESGGISPYLVAVLVQQAQAADAAATDWQALAVVGALVGAVAGGVVAVHLARRREPVAP